MLGELEHLKIKTRLIDEMFASVMGDDGWHTRHDRKKKKMKYKVSVPHYSNYLLRS